MTEIMKNEAVENKEEKKMTFKEFEENRERLKKAHVNDAYWKNMAEYASSGMPFEIDANDWSFITDYVNTKYIIPILWSYLKFKHPEYLSKITCMSLELKLLMIYKDYKNIDPSLEKTFREDVYIYGGYGTLNNLDPDEKKYFNFIAADEERIMEEYRKKELERTIKYYKEHYNDLTPKERANYEEVIAREGGVI